MKKYFPLWVFFGLFLISLRDIVEKMLLKVGGLEKDKKRGQFLFRKMDDRTSNQPQHITFLSNQVLEFFA